MPDQYCEHWEGPVKGLRLRLAAWNSLHDEGITAIDQLKAVADRLERMVGIGSNTCQEPRFPALSVRLVRPGLGPSSLGLGSAKR